MNTEALTELRAMHDTLGKLIDKIDNSNLHRQLTSLVGLCDIRKTDSLIIARKIRGFDKHSNGKVIIICDLIEVYHGDECLEIKVLENKHTYHSQDEAVRISQYIGADRMKPSDFDDMRCWAEFKMKSGWEDLSGMVDSFSE